MTREEIERRVAEARTWADLDQLSKDCIADDQRRLTDQAAEYLAARILEMPAIQDLIANAKAD